MSSRRGAPLFVIAMVSTILVLLVPLAAQTAGAKPRPWTPLTTADGQPDLQGVWTDTSATPLERPAAFAGRSLLTDEEVRRLKERWDRLSSSDNDFLAGDNFFLALVADLPSVNNPNATGTALNMVPRVFDNRTSLITDPADGRIPPLTPEGLKRQAAAQASTLAIPWQPGVDAATARQRQAAAEANRALPSGPEDLSNLLRCISWGVPKLSGNFNYASHYQIIQSPGSFILLNEVNHEARIIPIDGRAHLPQTLRQWNGDSRGHWEGPTLIVDTTNFSPKSFFMGSAADLHLTERFRRISADTITYEVTIDDRTTWTRPWTAVVRLQRSEDSLYESACHEGNYEVISGILAGARAEEKARRSAPGEPK